MLIKQWGDFYAGFMVCSFKLIIHKIQNFMIHFSIQNPIVVLKQID